MQSSQVHRLMARRTRPSVPITQDLLIPEVSTAACEGLELNKMKKKQSTIEK